MLAAGPPRDPPAARACSAGFATGRWARRWGRCGYRSVRYTSRTARWTSACDLDGGGVLAQTRQNMSSYIYFIHFSAMPSTSCAPLRVAVSPEEVMDATLTRSGGSHLQRLAHPCVTAPRACMLSHQLRTAPCPRPDMCTAPRTKEGGGHAPSSSSSEPCMARAPSAISPVSGWADAAPPLCAASIGFLLCDAFISRHIVTSANGQGNACVFSSAVRKPAQRGHAATVGHGQRGTPRGSTQGGGRAWVDVFAR